MRISVTGGAGYVGSTCLRRIVAEGHEAIAYDNLVEGHPSAVGGATLIEGDIADTAPLSKTLRDFNV